MSETASNEKTFHQFSNFLLLLFLEVSSDFHTICVIICSLRLKRTICKTGNHAKRFIKTTCFWHFLKYDLK